MEEITVIGSGLAGGLVAVYLAKRGYRVELYDSRPDIRSIEKDSGRSINLAMSCRGLTGLSEAGLASVAQKYMVPMRARAIHQENSQLMYQAFGRHQDEYINAISRKDLNRVILDHLEDLPGVHLFFNMKLQYLDVHKKFIYFDSAKEEPFAKNYNVLIGADGASSFVRETLVSEKIISATREFLPHGYKELTITPPDSKKWPQEHLHLWPRDSFLLLGNPNPDHSITGSLFMPHEGRNSFAELDNELLIERFFKDAFPDACDSMPHLTKEFMEHPTGNMSTVVSSPWYYKDQCMLIGDAAHGVVPFFGQGMNSAFEDCRILNALLDKHHDDWMKVMPAFYEARKKNTEAVAAMSLENYHEIQSDIRDARFNLRKNIEQELMRRYPGQYVSKHVLVMFTNTPYATALDVGKLQTELLQKISDGIETLDQIKWGEVDDLMKNYDKKLAKILS